MKITAYVTNYTGAHFRGISDTLDGRACKVVLQGDEAKIVTYLLENCAYGQDEDDPIKTIKKLAKGLKKHTIPQYDGCGGIDRIVLEDGNVVHDSYDEMPLCDKDGNNLPFDKVQFVDVGVVDVDAITEPFDHITRMLSDLEDAGKLPLREGGEDDGEDD